MRIYAAFILPATIIAVLLSGCATPAVSGAQPPQTARSRETGLSPKIVEPFANARAVMPGRWRGFSITDYQDFSGQGTLREIPEDLFEIVSAEGFNFIRLPLDYRAFTRPNRPESIDPEKIALIDRAVELAQKHGLHLMIQFLRVPGYCSFDRGLGPDGTRLWTDEHCRELYLGYWSYFARRYQKVAPAYLSFNLLYEPYFYERSEQFSDLALKAIGIIRSYNKDRVISTDGIDWAAKPARALYASGILQDMQSFDAIKIAEFHAEWSASLGSMDWPVPAWPLAPANSFLVGSDKGNLQIPLRMRGHFKAGDTLIINVGTVSISADFQIKADGAIVFEHKFRPGSGNGEWKKVIFKKEYGVYQDIYDREYQVTLTADAEELSLGVANGDWLDWNYIKVVRADGTVVTIQPQFSALDTPQSSILVSDDNQVSLIEAPAGYKEIYAGKYLKAWKEALADGLPGAFVGGFGVYSKTPHDVTLAYLESRLQEFKELNLGWVLIDLKGPFGILDSGRKDVNYEDCRGYKLDRTLLELLKKY